ncbi:helix-turn-helix domain-containing protein [Dysgonomonas termitidis]|uniref:Helix-turn-helix domain-containing protein n=1 Tax=Dysgonomonas termitidis TaxID=1516126 RepID=A0ABV9KU94_9BACT
MEVITFESKAYKDLADKIDRIAQYVTQKETVPPSQSKGDDSIDNRWLDNFEVAELLKISTRTLQRLRSKNLISFSLLGGKCYYQVSDIETALRNRLIRCTPETIAEFRKNFLLYAKQK